MVPNPILMNPTDWADQVCFVWSKYGYVGKLLDESAWQDWGASLRNNLTIGADIPNPFEFDNWKDWAERLNQLARKV